jgi:hypothetical protein
MNPPPRPNPAYATATHEARLDVHKNVAEGTRRIHVEVIYTPEQQRQIQMEHVEHLRRLIAEMQRETSLDRSTRNNRLTAEAMDVELILEALAILAP